MCMNEHFPDISSLVKLIDSLPALSWLVDLSDRARVFVGPQVEVQLNREMACVFEGCWDGCFDEQVLTSVNFYGSGFVLNQDKIVFSTPTHTLSSLFVLMGRKRKNWRTYGKDYQACLLYLFYFGRSDRDIR